MAKSDGFGEVLGLVAIAAWLTSIIGDMIAGRFIWMIVDIVLSPIGMVRGILMWFGVV